MPWFDPADGGAAARTLFLLEKPSRGSAVLTDGPAFISMDNPTSGARRMKALMAEAGVATPEERRRILVWNAVPWWNGKVAVTAAELRDGAEALEELLALLPDLRSVCLVGRKAETVWARAGTAAVPVFVSAHYSANVRAAFPDRWAAIPGIWREAYSAAAAMSAASPKT